MHHVLHLHFFKAPSPTPWPCCQLWALRSTSCCLSQLHPWGIQGVAANMGGDMTRHDMTCMLRRWQLRPWWFCYGHGEEWGQWWCLHHYVAAWRWMVVNGHCADIKIVQFPLLRTKLIVVRTEQPHGVVHTCPLYLIKSSSSSWLTSPCRDSSLHRSWQTARFWQMHQVILITANHWYW